MPFMKKLFKRTTQVVLAGVASVGLYLGYLQISDNFGTVVPNEVYRSAQPTADAIHEYATRNGIKTILNLRGENKGSPWYDNEVAAAKELGITHIDFGMSARRELDSQSIAQLIAIMRDAPKPLLIHCKAGSDRTGLASALYLAAVKKEDVKVAEGEITLYYGHVSLSFIPEYAMDRTFAVAATLLDLARK